MEVLRCICWSIAVDSSFPRASPPTIHSYKDLPGWWFFEKHIPDYAAQQHNAQFCLAALGWVCGVALPRLIVHGHVGDVRTVI